MIKLDVLVIITQSKWNVIFYLFLVRLIILIFSILSCNIELWNVFILTLRDVLVVLFQILDILVCGFLMNFCCLIFLLNNFSISFISILYLRQRVDTKDFHYFLSLMNQGFNLLRDGSSFVFEMHDDIHLDFKLLHELLPLFFLLFFSFKLSDLFLNQ